MEAVIPVKIVCTITPVRNSAYQEYYERVFSLYFPIKRKWMHGPDRQTLLHESWKRRNDGQYLCNLQRVLALNSSDREKQGQEIELYASNHELKSILDVYSYFMKPRAQNQNWTSAPNLVTPNYFPSSFASQRNDIPNIYSVLSTQPTCHISPHLTN